MPRQLRLLILLNSFRCFMSFSKCGGSFSQSNPVPELSEAGLPQFSSLARLWFCSQAPLRDFGVEVHPKKMELSQTFHDNLRPIGALGGIQSP